MSKYTLETLLKRAKQGYKLSALDIGRLGLADISHWYKHKFKDSLVEFGTFQELYNKIDSEEEMKIYESFRYLYEFTKRLPNLYAESCVGFEKEYFQLLSIIYDSMEAELQYRQSRFKPLYVTEEEYNRLYAEEMRIKGEEEFTPEDLFFHQLHFLIGSFNEGKAEPSIAQSIEATKEQEITRNRIIKESVEKVSNSGHYETLDGFTEQDLSPEVWTEYKESNNITWRAETIESRKLSRFDILPIADQYYYSKKTGKTTGLQEFAEDYPEIYVYLMEELITHPQLSFLEGLSYKEYFKSCISFKELAEKDVFTFKQELQEFAAMNVKGYNGVAIVKGSTLDEASVDNLNNEIMFSFEKHLAESLLSPEMKGLVKRNLERVKLYILEIYSIKGYALALEHKYNVPGYADMLPNQDRFMGMVKLLNERMSFFYSLTRDGRTAHEMEERELNKELRKLFKPIREDIADIEAEAEARYIPKMDINNTVNNGLTFIYGIDEQMRYIYSERENRRPKSV